MFTSFSTALSALNATSTAIDVVGNNLANLNSPGFKTSAVIFRDLVTQSLGAGLGETQVGFGTGHAADGAPVYPGRHPDRAPACWTRPYRATASSSSRTMRGNTLYTRAGNFQADKYGNLLTDTGDRVQGWTTINSTTGEIDTNGPIGNIIVPVGSLKAPTVTSQFTLDLNLNSSASADSHLRILHADHGLRQPGHVARADHQFPEDRRQPVELRRQHPRRRSERRHGGNTGFDLRRERNPDLRQQRPADRSRLMGLRSHSALPGLADGANDMALYLESVHLRRSRADHAVRPAVGALGQFAERLAGGAAGACGPGGWRSNPGAVLERRPGGGGAGGAGVDPQSRHADRRGKQQLPAQRAHGHALHRGAGHRRPRNHRGRRRSRPPPWTSRASSPT